MGIEDIKFGDIVTYRSGRKNNVNKPDEYNKHYNKNFENKGLPTEFDIVRIQRYVKILWFYKLKTIYRRYK